MSTKNLSIPDSDYLSVKISNRQLNIKEYDEGIVNLASFPRVVFVELTQNCNIYCPMCRPKLKYDNTKNMDFEIFKRFADELFPYAELIDLRGYGESTMLKDFPKFLEYSAKFGARLKLFTNMAVNSNSLWEMLASYGVVLAVSFDGGSKSTFERIRAGAKFEKTLQNLASSVAYYKHYGLVPSEYIYFSTTVQKDNLDELQQIVSILAEHELDMIKLFPIGCADSDPRNLRHYPNEIKTALNELNIFASRLGVTVELGESLHSSLTLPDKVISRCIHPWSYCVLDYKGQVGYCDNLIGLLTNVMGSIHNSDFKTIWNNNEYTHLRFEHLNNRPIGSRFTACNTCYKRRYNETEHMFHNSYLQKCVSLEKQAILLNDYDSSS